jgi:sugar/nucleoside kinase (ribokinase family)
MQGANGCTVLDGGRLLRPRYGHEVQVVDPIGAGAAYVGGFLTQAPHSALGLRSPGECRALTLTRTSGALTAPSASPHLPQVARSTEALSRIPREIAVGEINARS